MRYIGRHRAPRPIYLRRPVVGGVVVAALIAAPALALTGTGTGLMGAKADPSASSSPSTTPSTTPSNPAVVVPTDGVLPSDIPTTAPRTTAPTSAVTTAPSVAGSTTRATTTRPTTRTTRPTTKTSTRTPTKTTTKPAPDPLALVLANVPRTATVAAAYSGSAGADGGTKPYTFRFSGLPDGLSASGANVSGTPTTAGAVVVTVKVTDAAGKSTSSGITVTVNDAPAP